MNKMIDLINVLRTTKNDNLRTELMVRVATYGLWKAVKNIHDGNTSTIPKDVATQKQILVWLENHLNPNRKDGKMKMNTVQEFKEFVQSFDENNDGKISREELQKALNELGIPLAGLEAWYAVATTDKDSTGFIDNDKEWNQLLKHADQHWAIFNRGN
ncbi:hypothetical protein IFM89_001968 [Coptis chinensis]|uniref:EF-hand domain-containing protein n=1 Tax=Coptis chinensis TaxID=261450 RepID=A0A835LLE7_9MAGN|nr:hypothetical protein IFM89_001968 [Coptis chinensis]